MCGIVGVFGHDEAAWLTSLGLHALQHRGQEGSGICSTDGKKMHVHRGDGLVSEVYREDALGVLPGRAAIGHNRYSTTGGAGHANLQPLIASYRDGTIALAHNGNLVNARELREECEHLGSIFQGTVDSEVLIHLLARARPDDLEGRMIQALSRVRGAYSLVALTPKKMIGVRDPNGFRPLCIGRLDGAWLLASESCALDILGAEYMREVEPGEMLIITEDGLESREFGVKAPRAECVFEHVYFSRPDSLAFHKNVNAVRVELGRQLAREHPVKAGDVVMSVPDSSNAAAVGFSQESGIALEHGLIRNHYVGRTFIKPSQGLRNLSVRLKFNAVREVLEGRSVVVVDDSIVRGTTSRSLVKMMRKAGAKEIHFRISSPPVAHPCFYGIDMPTHDELLAHGRSLDEIRDFIGVDTIGYLSLEGMLKAVHGGTPGACHACFTGEYPVKWKRKPSKVGLEKVQQG